MGEYKIDKGQFDAFFTEYARILKDSFAWEYTGSWDYSVRVKS